MSGEVAPAQRCSFWPGIVGYSGHCEHVHCHGEEAKSSPALTLASSRTLNKAKAAVDELINHLAPWQELAVDEAPHIEECDQHDLDFGLRLSCSLRFW